MKSTMINVSGMSCQHCVQSIERGLKEHKGILEVDVILQAKTVKVTYDELLVKNVDLENWIEEIGYNVI